LAQKSYKKKIHNKVTIYQTKKMPVGMKVSRIMKIIEKRIPKHFLSEIDTVVIADISKISSFENSSLDGVLEGDTIFVNSEQYCEDLLVDTFAILVGESLFARHEGVISSETLITEFIKKRRDLYYDLLVCHRDLALSDFLGLDHPYLLKRALRKVDFEDAICNIQKHFVNYDSCLSFKNYFSHHFAAILSGNIRRKEYSELSNAMASVENICKENKKNEKEN